MKRLAHISTQQPAKGRGVAAMGKVHSDMHPNGHVRCNEAGLEVAADVMADKAIRGIVEDLIVPMLVDSFIQKLVNSRPESMLKNS